MPGPAGEASTSEAWDAARNRGYAVSVRIAPATAASTAPPAIAVIAASAAQPRQRARNLCATRRATASIRRLYAVPRGGR